MPPAAFELAISRGHRDWQCSVNVLGYYSGGTHFDSWSNYRLSQLKCSLSDFSLFRMMSEWWATRKELVLFSSNSFFFS